MAATTDNTHSQGIGTTYMYNDPATVKQATINKIQVLYRTDPVIAQYAQSFFELDAGIPKSSIDAKNQSLDKYSRNLFQTTFSQELTLAKKGSSETVGQKIVDFFKPISSHVGSTLGNQDGVLGAPFLGTANFLPSGLSNVVKKVSVGFAASMDAAHKKYKLDTTQHAPSQVQGSPKAVAATGPNASYPPGLIPDLYNGVMSVMSNMSGIVDEAKTIGIQFTTSLLGGVLNGIIPPDLLLPVLDTASQQAMTLKGKSDKFNQTDKKDALTSSVQNQSAKLGSDIKNPLTTATHYIPKPVTGGVAAFNAPLSIVGNYLPSTLASSFSNPQSLAGFGNSGNLGFGLQSALKPVQNLAVQSALSNFKGKEAILGPLLTLGADVLTTSLSPLSTNPPAKKPSVVNPGIVVAQGVPQEQITPNPILQPAKSSTTSGTGLSFSSTLNGNLPTPPVSFTSLQPDASKITVTPTFKNL